MFWFLGGDARMKWAARTVEEQGFCVHTHGVPEGESQPLPSFFPRLVLPFPSFSKGMINSQTAIPVAELLSRLRPGSRVYGAMLGDFAQEAEARGAEVIDLYDSEPLTTKNAIPTAEAAIALAVLHSPITLHGSACLVIGAGRIGKVISVLLRNLGAKVTLAARKDADYAFATKEGLRSEQTGLYSHGLQDYDYIFNTVPAPVLSEAQLREVKPECLLMELASKAGFAPDHGTLRVLQAPGLPGKYSPKTAGILYGNSILEREVRP